MTGAPVLQARGLVKKYGNVTAINGADFELREGEVLAVIGDNGAGKTSLIKALAGAVVPDSGEILMNGTRVSFKNTRDARAAGIETVYQDLAVVPALDIASNLYLGREVRRKGIAGSLFRRLDMPRMRQEASQHLADLKIGIKSVNQAVETLSGGQRQGVAVARAAAFGRGVIIMDEPTAALGVRESGQVIDLRGVDVPQLGAGGSVTGQDGQGQLLYKVSAGDTPAGIASRYGIPLYALRIANMDLLTGSEWIPPAGTTVAIPNPPVD